MCFIIRTKNIWFSCFEFYLTSYRTTFKHKSMYFLDILKDHLKYSYTIHC